MAHFLGNLTANLTNLFWFVFAIFCFNLTPGPDFLLLIRTTIKNGWRQSSKIMFGVCASTTVWNLCAVVGISALLAKSPKGTLILKGLGGIYLLYMGLSAIYSTFKRVDISEEIERENLSEKVAGFKDGFAADFLNPATGLFALTFFPQFVLPGYSPKSYLLLLTAVQDLAILLSYGGLIILSAKGARVFQHPIVSKAMDWVAGILFIYFGVTLLMATKF